MVNKRTSRIDREKRTISALISLYCKSHHAKIGHSLCEQCQDIHNYAVQRLKKCPFIENKPTCANCLVHCYNQDMQKKVKQIMRYSGPRLLLVHPILAIRHLLDNRIEPSPLNRKKNNKKKTGEAL